MGTVDFSRRRHHTNYYKFVNMFTDVKHLKENAARRKYLDFLLPTPKGRRFNSHNMYLYLFVRSFVRGKRCIKYYSSTCCHCTCTYDLVVSSTCFYYYW